MARVTNAAITFNDALYMVNNEGYSVKNSFSGSNTCMTRSDIENYLYVDNSNFTSYASNRLVPYHLLQPAVVTAWRPIDPYCVQEDSYELMLKTTSNSSTWCFDRFRLYTADIGTMVQLRKENGVVLATKKFHDTKYFSVWNYASYDHTFFFDLSFNTNNDEISLFVTGKDTTMKFQQLYATDNHAGSGVRWGVDDNLTTITNAQVSYLNMDFLRFDQDSSAGFVYLENQGLSTIIGADKFFGRVLYINGNNLTSADIDQVIVGIDNNGVQPSTVGGQACILQIDAGLRTSASASAWSSLTTKGWTLNEV